MNAAKTCVIENLIGKRIKQRRKSLKFSQAYVAKLLGITGQQLHKYEKGIDRVSAGRLLEISQILSTPLSFFYQGMADFQETGNILTVRGMTNQGKEIVLKIWDEDSLFKDITVLRNETSLTTAGKD